MKIICNIITQIFLDNNEIDSLICFKALNSLGISGLEVRVIFENSNE